MVCLSRAVQATASLLHCVDVADGVDSSTRVLFRAGTVQCFAGWQYAVAALLGVLTCVPLVAAWVALRPRKPSQGWLSSALQEWCLRAHRDSMNYWTAVLLAALYGLALVSSLVRDPSTRILTLGLCIAVILTLQGWCRPFRSARHNAFQALLWLLLLALSALSTPRADSVTLASSDAQLRHLPAVGSIVGVLLLAPLIVTLLGVGWQWSVKRD